MIPFITKCVFGWNFTTKVPYSAPMILVDVLRVNLLRVSIVAAVNFNVLEATEMSTLVLLGLQDL